MSTDDADTATTAGDRLPVGSLLSDTYEIVRHIKRGGMADVYQAMNVHTREPVALKVVLTEFAKNEQFTALFRKEGTVLSRLHNDAIVHYQVFTVDRETQRPYLVMEYIDGATLSEVIADAPMEAGRVHQLLLRVASGLGAAHQLGVVHRDLKPDNILLPGGDVTAAKIIDFGIAKAPVGGGTTLVGSGFAGTYMFVSPEQLGLFGNNVTARSDIYSLGLVLAAALLGKPIDMGGSHLDVIEKRRVVPDLSAIDPSIRPIIEWMLQPDPADRPASLAEVVAMPLAVDGHGPGSEDPWSVPSASRSEQTVLRPGPVSIPSMGPGRRPQTIPPAAPADDNATRLMEVARLAQARTQELRAPGSTSFAPSRQGGIAPVDAATLGGGDSPFGSGNAAPRAAQVSKQPPKRSNPWPLIVGLVVVVALGGGGFYAFQSGLISRLTGPSATPTDSGPSTTPSVVTQPATSTPAATEASSAPVVPASPPPTDLVAEAQPWIDRLPKDDCQIAFASVSPGGAVSVNEYSLVGTRIAGLANAFERWAGVAPSVSAYPIEQAQCAVVDFVNTTKPLTVAGPTVSLARETLSNGNSLVGLVSNSSGWTTTVLLVDNSGTLYDATAQLDSQGNDKSFVFPVKLMANGGGSMPMMVVAISSKTPIAALVNVDKKSAWPTFRAIRKEIFANSSRVAVSVAWFQIS